MIFCDTAASKITMKQISEDRKSFLTKDMENNAKKIQKNNRKNEY